MSYEKVAFELELEKEQDLGTESMHALFYLLIQQMFDFFCQVCSMSHELRIPTFKEDIFTFNCFYYIRNTCSL